MSVLSNAKILAGRPAVDFVGRDAEADRIFAHARSSNDGLLILATPGAGASELLKQVYDRLFRDQQDVVPFYFSVRPTFKSSRDVAAAFLDEFIRQLVAFRRQDPTVFRSPVSLDELAELSLSVGGFWIDRLIDSARRSWSDPDGGRSFIRNCLAAPLRAAANDARPVVLIDHVQTLGEIEGGTDFLDELNDVFEYADVPFVLCGHRRFQHRKLDRPRIELDHLNIDHAARVAEIFAAEIDIKITDETRDLIATQMGRNLRSMRQIISEAHDSGVGLESFTAVEQAYADTLFGGRIGIDFDAKFASACRSREVERSVVSMLFDGQVSETGRVERERWYRRLQLSETEAESLLDRLNVTELIRLTPIFVEPMSENIPLVDYIAMRFRLSIASESRAAVYSESLAGYIKRAPEIMARSYIVRSSLGVREVLGGFAGQKVPSTLINYGEFRDEMKGRGDEEVLVELARQPASMTLPKIFFTTAASAFYRPIAQIAESERSAIALGFEPSADETGEEIVWIAAEIDSKLEATSELAEFWCDRLEAAALMCGFARFRIWLIANEGFSPEALETLRVRKAYGSSRRQVNLLRGFLKTPASSLPPLAENEYEMVIPMNGEAELIAAHAIEEIARRHNLDARSINQVKTALVEACINASEHSLSPDGKIYQRFRVEGDRVVLTVSNRGLRLTSNMPADEPDEGRRGWGLKLMRRLMDEVTIEQVDDGTRIVMTKYLKAA
jgi:serine/threonine-protein kinase RsbW